MESYTKINLLLITILIIIPIIVLIIRITIRIIIRIIIVINLYSETQAESPMRWVMGARSGGWRRRTSSSGRSLRCSLCNRLI